MAISVEEFTKEKKILRLTNKLLGETLDSLKSEVREDYENLKEFK